MIAVDTNVVVRFLVADDPEQSAQARDLFAAEPIFIPDTVILETAWVLSYSYGLDNDIITAGLRRLFGLVNVHLRDMAEMALALEWYDGGLDFADALHLAQSAHCTRLLTFDRRFAARGEGISGVPVGLVGERRTASRR
jgi:predicted nucleic-acid-binding protein